MAKRPGRRDLASAVKRLRITRPRPVANWPRSGLTLVALLAIVAVIVVALTLTIRPGWPKTPSDQWAALGAIYGAGALALAVLATVIATVAYTNATERPALVMHSSMAMQFQDWSLTIELENRGRVAARFVAVRLGFVGAGLALPYTNFPIDGAWRSGPAGWDGATKAFWDGGADVVIHPNWNYVIPVLRCNVSRVGDEEPFVDVQVVADEFPGFVTRLALSDHPIERPTTVTEEDLAVRASGSEFVTRLLFITFGRPGVRPIRSSGDQRTPSRLDFVRPEKRTLRQADLPSTVTGTHGVVIVTSLTPGGFVVNEEGSVGEEVEVFLYF